MKTYEQFMEELRRRKAERWAKILASEPPGHAPGRRPRDPEQERMLLKLDRVRLARREAAGAIRITKVEVTPSVEPAEPSTKGGGEPG